MTNGPAASSSFVIRISSFSSFVIRPSSFPLLSYLVQGHTLLDLLRRLQRRPLAARRTCCSGRSGCRRRARCRKTSTPSGSLCPSSTTSAFRIAANGCWIDTRLPVASSSVASKRWKKSSVASGNGLPANVAKASRSIPCIPHHSTGLMHSSGVAARQVDRAVGALGVGHVAAVDAPVIAVQIGQRQIENPQRLELRRGHRPKKCPRAPPVLRVPRPIRSERRTAGRSVLAAAGVPLARSYPLRRWQALRSSVAAM